MSNNKQSSIDLFIDQLEEKAFKESIQGANRIHIVIDVNEYLSLKQQAKAMHKEEIIKAVNVNTNEADFDCIEPEQYYNKTFGGNNEE